MKLKYFEISWDIDPYFDGRLEEVKHGNQNFVPILYFYELVIGGGINQYIYMVDSQGLNLSLISIVPAMKNTVQYKFNVKYMGAEYDVDVDEIESAFASGHFKSTNFKKEIIEKYLDFISSFSNRNYNCSFLVKNVTLGSVKCDEPKIIKKCTCSLDDLMKHGCKCGGT